MGKIIGLISSDIVILERPLIMIPFAISSPIMGVALIAYSVIVLGKWAYYSIIVLFINYFI